jgi:hypothetical protein
MKTKIEMTDYTKFQPKLTRADAYDFYKRWVADDRKISISDAAEQFGVCSPALRSKLKAIDLCIQRDKQKMFGHENHLKNYLAYRWKNGGGWSISIWSPDHPAKRQLSLPHSRS